MGGNTSHYFCKRDVVSLQNLEIHCFKDDAGEKNGEKNSVLSVKMMMVKEILLQAGKNHTAH